MRSKPLPLVLLSFVALGLGVGAGCGGGDIPAPSSATPVGGMAMVATVRVESVPSGAEITVNGEDMGTAPATVRLRVNGGAMVDNVTIHLKWQDREVDYQLSAGSLQPAPILKINQNGGTAF